VQTDPPARLDDSGKTGRFSEGTVIRLTSSNTEPGKFCTIELIKVTTSFIFAALAGLTA
jgi:hypothetical protein